MDPLFSSGDIKKTQNRLGTYLSLSVWSISLVFCFYYFAMGAPVRSLSILGILAVIGILAARLFSINKNALAIVSQCICMYASVIVVLSLPTIGKYAVMCLLIITLTPIVLLNTMHTGVVFLNLVLSLLILSIYELTGFSEIDPLERILDFFIKFMVIILVFVQVYGLRMMFERPSPKA